MTLRARVLVGFAVVLVIVAGVGTSVVLAQRSQLIDQLDRRLVEIAPLGRPAPPDRTTGPPPPERAVTTPISDLFIATIDANGTTTTVIDGQLNTTTPDLEGVVDDPPPTRTFGFVSGEDGDSRFRVVVEPIADGEILVVALPTSDVDETIDRLVVTFVVVALVIAAVLGLLAWWIVRLGLRPISDVAATAHAVADGDRERRAPELDRRTEAGELAAAFNVMLDQRNAAEDRLRRFASDASHELRTPLTSIRGYLDLYAAGGFREEGQLDDVIRRMSDEAARMGVLVDDLLQLARFDEGQRLELETTDLAEIVRDVVENARAAHPDRRIAADLTDDRIVTELDRARITQVVVLLVDNAIVHAPDADVTVAASAADDGIVVTVTDDGPGLDAEHAEKVFTRFFRTDDSRARASGGSGLGLSIAHDIVVAHGGTIDLTTAPGAGCEFSVSIPSTPVSATAAQ